MYTGFFVNFMSGELLRTSQPKDNPCNVFYPDSDSNGWSQIHFDMWQIMKNVQNMGLKLGGQGWESID